MSVVSEIAMFPLGHTHGMGKFVKRVIDVISESGVEYTLTAMGTIFETEDLQHAFDIIQKAYSALEPDSERVYCTAKFDISKTGTGRMKGKVLSVREEL